MSGLPNGATPFTVVSITNLTLFDEEVCAHLRSVVISENLRRSISTSVSAPSGDPKRKSVIE